jgi:hypothetical protein
LLPLLLPPLLLFALGACTPDYPLDRPGTWNVPSGTLGSNDTNLRAMVVDPRDLTEGASADGSEGYEAVAPVRRLITGRRPALPNLNASTIDAIGGQASTPTGTAGLNGSVQAQ